MATTSQHRLPFGKHRGQPLDQVPLQYLRWLRDTCTFRDQRFADALDAYLRQHGNGPPKKLAPRTKVDLDPLPRLPVPEPLPPGSLPRDVWMRFQRWRSAWLRRYRDEPAVRAALEEQDAELRRQLGVDGPAW